MKKSRAIIVLLVLALSLVGIGFIDLYGIDGKGNDCKKKEWTEV